RGGDGFAAVHRIDGGSHDLGTVKVTGDLTEIDAGDGNFTTPAVKSLTVQSMGGACVAAFALPTSELMGGAGSITAKGDVYGVRIEAIGGASKIGGVTIGGSFASAGMKDAGLFSDGTIGTVKIGRNLEGEMGAPIVIAAKGVATPAKAADAVAIKSVSV